MGLVYECALERPGRSGSNAGGIRAVPLSGVHWQP
jgi:hypothetical protein